MRLKGEEYRKRLAGYSHSTIELISWANSCTIEVALKATDISTDSELNEEEVRTKLIELLNSIDLDSETEN